MLQEHGGYAFEVASKATKPQIKAAVEKAFKVKVIKVNVMTMPGKMKRIGRKFVMTPSWRKAVVTLSPGDKIEFFEGV
jgi:large subunit ribosomal protein L23